MADHPNMKHVHISFSVWVYQIKFIITAIQRIDCDEDASLKRRNLRVIQNMNCQVTYETELSGTPTAVFTEIQLIGQLLVLGIIILI